MEILIASFITSHFGTSATPVTSAQAEPDDPSWTLQFEQRLQNTDIELDSLNVKKKG